MVKFEFSAGIIVYKIADNTRYYLFLDVGGGRYGPPKGHIEKGENALEAAKRETLEEAGISVVPDKYFKRKIRYWFMNENEKVNKTVTAFLAEADKDAKVKISHEHNDFTWMTLDEVRKKVHYRSWIPVILAADSYLNKLDSIKKINEEYSKIPQAAKNWELSKRFVPGEGPADAKIVVVGQAPGRNEDIELRPFIGMAGKLLTHLLKLAGLNRENVYIMSVVQFFPPENRIPTDEEVGLCKPLLYKQTGVIKPKLVIALGNLACSTLTGKTNVMNIHGTVAKSKEHNVNVFLTLHPAAAVRIKSNMPIIEEDFRKLKKTIAEL